jgi:ATP-binding cassette subfamily F protein 3
VVSGKLRTGHNVKIGFLSQHADGLQPGTARTVVEVAQRATGLTPGKARALLGQFLFSGEDAEKPLDGLSGGERQRLALAILVHSGANVLILDEPTNHLDLESREALEQALAGFQGSLLLISHDRALLDAVGSRTVAFEPPPGAADGATTLRSYVGGWPEYLRAREAAKARPAAPPPERPARSSSSKRAPAKRANGGGRRRGAVAQQELEQQIERAEAELRSLEDELADPALWATPGRSAEATARHEQAKQRVEELVQRWEEIAT